MIKKNQDGITLIYLIIILIIIIIISGVAIYSGFDTIQETAKTTLLNELQVIQGKVDVICQQIQNGDINYNNYLNELKVNESINIESNSGTIRINSEFRKFETQNDLRKIGVDGIKNTYYINFKTVEVVSQKGYIEGNKKYHTLKDFDYYQTEEKTKIESSLTNDFEIEVTITYPSNSTVKKYKLNENGLWQDYESKFEVDNNTVIYTKFVKEDNNNEILSTTKQIRYDRLTDNGFHNAPKLSKGMTPIKLENSQWVETTQDDENWYDYQNQQFAHIKLKDGSIFVWIPRFTVNTLSLDELRYSRGISDQYNTNNLFLKNEIELTGIWVAKYPASDIVDMNLIQSKLQNDYNVSIEDLEQKCTYIKQYTGTYGLYQSEVDTFIITSQDIANIKLLDGYNDNLTRLDETKEDRPLIIIK